MEWIMRFTLISVGLVNVFPVIAAFNPNLLNSLYGVDVSDPNLLILLQHRAVLFGIMGGFMIMAAFDSALHNAAFVMGMVSMLAYVVIAWIIRDYNAAIQRVIMIDLVASAVLLGVYVLHRFNRG
jgi:hypothetical protein